MDKWRLWLRYALIFLLVLFAFGCETMNPEWSGNMPNESGRHVKPYRTSSERNGGEAIRPSQIHAAFRKGLND